jgi:glycosyltransferase 2 family protein
LLYYIAPFVLALTILGLREIWLNVKGTRAAEPKLIKSVTAPIRTEIEGKKTDAD